jgi:adenine-specific DNA methylase
LVVGKKGSGTTIETDDGEYDPNTTTTISRGVGKCLNCDNVIENDVIMQAATKAEIKHQLYAVAYREGKSSLQFKIPTKVDLDGIAKTEAYLQEKLNALYLDNILPIETIPEGQDFDEQIRLFCPNFKDMFNPR